MIVERDGVEYGFASDIGARLTEAGLVNGPGLIYKWKQLGLLTPAGIIGNRPYFRVADVLKVEMQTRQTKTRRGGRTRLTSATSHFILESR